MRALAVVTLALLSIAGCLDGGSDHVGKPAKVSWGGTAGTQWTAQLGQASVEIEVPPLPTVACIIETPRTVACIVGTTFGASGGSMSSATRVTLAVAGTEQILCDADLAAQCAVASEAVQEFVLDATDSDHDLAFSAHAVAAETRVGGDEAEADAERAVHVSAVFDDRGFALPADP